MNPFLWVGGGVEDYVAWEDCSIVVNDNFVVVEDGAGDASNRIVTSWGSGEIGDVLRRPVDVTHDHHLA